MLPLPDGEDQRREALRVLPIDKLEAGMVLACTGEQAEQFRRLTRSGGHLDQHAARSAIAIRRDHRAGVQQESQALLLSVRPFAKNDGSWDPL